MSTSGFFDLLFGAEKEPFGSEVFVLVSRRRADERRRSEAAAAFVAGSTLDATSGAFMFPARRIQPVPDGFILPVIRNHLEDLIPPLALVQVQPPPPARSAARHHRRRRLVLWTGASGTRALAARW